MLALAIGITASASIYTILVARVAGVQMVVWMSALPFGDEQDVATVAAGDVIPSAHEDQPESYSQGDA